MEDSRVIISQITGSLCSVWPDCRCITGYPNTFLVISSCVASISKFPLSLSFSYIRHFKSNYAGLTKMQNPTILHFGSTKNLFFVSSTQNQEKIFKRKLRHEKLNHESRNCFTINDFILYSCGWTACNCITFQSWRKPLISAKKIK